MKKIAGTKEETVQKATGKGWEEWLSVLDEEGAVEMPHPEIAALLRKKYNLSGWWAQMVTVGYEQERGLREPHEKKDGFEATNSRTFREPVELLFESWMDEELRAKWLSDPYFTVRTSIKNRSIRITWPDETFVTVYFTPKKDHRTQVNVQHLKLESLEEVNKKKAYWHNQLLQLQHLLNYPDGQ